MFLISTYLKTAFIQAHRCFKSQNSKPRSRKRYGLFNYHAMYSKWLCSRWCFCDKYSWMEDTKTWAVSFLVTSWVLICLHLESPRDSGAWWAAVYGVAQSQTQLKWLSSSSSIVWKCSCSKIHRTMSKKEMQFCHLSILCLPYYMAYIIISFVYQFFIFSSSSLLNANIIYYVPILNFTLKKCSVFIRLAGKWDLCALVKEEVWCHYINCNLKLLMDTAFFSFSYYYHCSWFIVSVKAY